MRIIDRLSAGAALTGFLARVGRLRRSVLSRRPAVRWGLALAAILGLAAAGYWAATSMVPVGARYLASGRRFSSEDLNKVRRVLEAQRIEYRCDDQHKIAVDADQFDQAAALVAKLDVGPRPIDQARDQVDSWSWLEGPREQEQKAKLAREKMVESLICKLDGVDWALVSINRPRRSVWQRAAARPTAFVYIETAADRQLPFRVVQSIPDILAGCEPDLGGSITVMDRRGHRYLDPANPSLGDISRKRAREEELSERILEQLDYIKGVRVEVRVTTPPAPEPAAPKAVDKPPRSQAEGFKPAVGLNRALELEPEPLPTAPAPVAAAVKHERGQVVITVPRSYYFNAMIDKDPTREPSVEELQKFAARTAEQIKVRVGLVVSDSGSWNVAIDTIPDDLPLARPAVLTSSADQRRKIVDWGMLGAVGVLVSVLVAVATRLQGARRPARLPEPIHKTRHYHADSASDPGPSERVRELIRRNPEAAASVLQRWTGQGSRVT